MINKTVAFFGDSFVGNFEGWIKHFCVNYNYTCLHTGKPGADPVYSFEKWKYFNETYQDQVDFCVYAHTEPNRLYHPEPDMGITSGTAADPPKLINKITDPNYSYWKAACQYYKHLVFPQAEDLKALLFPMAIDRYLEENNRVFKKIIHIWSFAPIRRYAGKSGWTAISSWPFDMKSGMNIILDLSNLSAAEPGYRMERQFDHRPLHFSLEYSWFVPEILNTAITYYDKNGSMDFRPLVDENSTWDDYIKAHKIIKGNLDENFNNRQ